MYGTMLQIIVGPKAPAQEPYFFVKIAHPLGVHFLLVAHPHPFFCLILPISVAGNVDTFISSPYSHRHGTGTGQA